MKIHKQKWSFYVYFLNKNIFIGHLSRVQKFVSQIQKNLEKTTLEKRNWDELFQIT
jgi:hypothetical protein